MNLQSYLVISIILFCLGIFCVLTRRKRYQHPDGELN